MRRRWLILLALLAGTFGAQAQPDPTTTVVVPVVGSVLGMHDVRWKTDVELVNDLGRESVVALQLPTAPDALAMILTLAPNESVRYVDVVGEAFGLDATMSPLLVTTDSRRSVTVRATVYGVRGTEVTPPQPIALSYGPSSYPWRVLDGLDFSDDFRTNIGIVNLGDQPAVFLLGLQRVPGRNIATTQVTVPPGTMWHHAVQVLFPLITKGSGFNVLVESAAPSTYVYASVVDNHDNSARFVQPRLGSQ